MSKHSIYNNVQHLFRPSRLSLGAVDAPARSSQKKSIASKTASCSTLSHARVPKPRPTISTALNKRCFASSSTSKGWAPARTLNRVHPEAPTDPKAVAEHLQEILSPLKFPEDVALRIMTHASWNNGADGHNTRLAYIGRRVLECYLNLFLHSRTESGLGTPHLFHRMDYEELATKILDTYVLGEYVGAAWKLERTMRWVPSHTNDPTRTMWSSGLYRVRGTTVEAIVGGVFHQFGGLVAHRLFHTRLLPHLTAASVLPISDSIRAAAAEASKAYGGPEAPLTRSPEKEISGKTLDRPISTPEGEAMRMPLGEFAYTGAKKPFPPGPPRLPPPPNSIRRIPSPPWKTRRGAGLVSKRLRSR
ncbi:hypothetical protein FRC14_000334 [Serendipita sp. 396]|nr:hypothetical protein FRC14_000334 [Serendipita sp. 396]KAG8779049.1 hypothetical protein FRC15_010394 [Serendipita sp. 397]KAG8827787.1 hypothetical protein FRC19_000291 [Serendipita sp. 401]KAG9057982.1 hypothetical protein FS842_002317 [Serendipita sp. 407]